MFKHTKDDGRIVDLSLKREDESMENFIKRAKKEKLGQRKTRERSLKTCICQRSKQLMGDPEQICPYCEKRWEDHKAYYFGKNRGWFRIFGYGIVWKDLRRYEMMFSERMGFFRYIVINHYLVRALRRNGV